jgi:Protein of unknown function (DUF3987)
MNPAGLNGNGSSKSGGNVASRRSDAHVRDWNQCLRTYRQEGIWDHAALGPPPGHPGCRVPPQLLQFYGYDVDLDIIIDAPRSTPEVNDGNEHFPHEPSKSGHAAAESKAGTDWPDPFPLPESLLAVDPFKLDLMPEKLRPFVEDVTERMQCPPDFVAVSLLAGLGSLIGRKVIIRPQAQNDWQACANMWALLIGRPGVLKSPAMEEALRPLKRLAAKADEAFKKTRLEHEVVANVAKLRAQENMKKATKLLKKESTADIGYLLSSEEEVPEPTLQRYIANDTNVASLGVLLQQNPNGLLVFRDELVSLLDNLDQEENASERGCGPTFPPNGRMSTVCPTKMHELPYLMFSKILKISIGITLALSGIAAVTVTKTGYHIYGLARMHSVGLSNGALTWKSGYAAAICTPPWNRIWQNIANSCPA